MTFTSGTFYSSKKKVRSYYRQYWKGIMVRDGKVGIIVNLVGARRSSYKNTFNQRTRVLEYIGEGLSGNQQATKQNQALIDAKQSNLPVTVFFDCGDLLRPDKHLLCMGQWQVKSFTYAYSKAAKRKIYKFKLEPSDSDTMKSVLSFSHTNADVHGYLKVLKAFAKSRHSLYQKYPWIIRSKDSIAGEVGEFAAIRCLSLATPLRPLLRFQNSFKDIDAVQIGTGKRFAVKAITRFPCDTSNIWSKDVEKAIDYFLIAVLDPETLLPKKILKMSANKVQKKFLKKDNYQGSCKIKINNEFVKEAESIRIPNELKK